MPLEPEQSEASSDGMVDLETAASLMTDFQHQAATAAAGQIADPAEPAPFFSPGHFSHLEPPLPHVPEDLMVKQFLPGALPQYTGPVYSTGTSFIPQDVIAQDGSESRFRPAMIYGRPYDESSDGEDGDRIKDRILIDNIVETASPRVEQPFQDYLARIDGGDSHDPGNLPSPHQLYEDRRLRERMNDVNSWMEAMTTDSTSQGSMDYQVGDKDGNLEKGRQTQPNNDLDKDELERAPNPGFSRISPTSSHSLRFSLGTGDTETSANAAMIRFQRALKDFEAISHCATEGSKRKRPQSVASNERSAISKAPSSSSTGNKEPLPEEIEDVPVTAPRTSVITPQQFMKVLPGWKVDATLPGGYRGAPHLLLETYHGTVLNIVDAVILCEASRIGLVSPIRPELVGQAAARALPGTVLVWCPNAGMPAQLPPILGNLGMHYSRVDFDGDDPWSYSSLRSHWRVTDPEGRDWVVQAYESNSPSELKRPLEDPLFVPIRRMFFPDKNRERNTLVPEENVEVDQQPAPSTHRAASRKNTLSTHTTVVDISPDSGYGSSTHRTPSQLKLLITSSDGHTQQQHTRALFESESRTEEDVHSVDQQTETGSIYSEVSAVSDTRKGYLSEFADELVRVVQPYQPDEEILQKISDALPDLLKAFALSMGRESSSQMQRDVMVFIHRYRRDIVAAFKERLVEEDTDKRKGQDENMSLDEIMNLWEQNKDEGPEPPQKIELHEDHYLAEWETLEPDETHEGKLPRVDAYRSLIQGTPTYTWLLSNVRKECILFTPGENIGKEIRSGIMQALPLPPKISRQSLAEIFNVSLRTQWDPSQFLLDEEYQEDPEVAIERALTFTGVNGEVQAQCCGEYMRETWPSTGDAVMKLIKSLVSKEHKGTVTLVDGTRVDISSHPSHSCALRSDTWIDARGTATCIAEIGEQLAWAACALQSSSKQDSLTRSKPVIESMRLGHVSPDGGADTYVFDIAVQLNDVDFTIGDCWRSLVSRPTVVEGFPIRRRPAECPPGVEIPLNIMAHLLDTRKVHNFDGRTVLKGFSNLLVPTDDLNDIISWHLVQGGDDKRISYLESEKFPALDIPINRLENVRHILGWCPEVKFYGGAPDANYNINDSRLSRRGGLNILKDRSLSTDYSIEGGTACSLGRKDIRVRRNGYVSKMRWVSQKYITFWDVGEERGWLLNGACALLHLARASLERDRSDPALRSICLLKGDELWEATRTHHPDSALEVLLNVDNLNIKLYQIDTNVTFKGRVEDLYDRLEKMYDYQVKGSAAHKDGTAVPRSLLEGWDFQDLVLERDTVHPRHTTLSQDGLSWVDFTRSIEAITLFGRDFGEIMKPLNLSCVKRSILKPRKSYLAATMFDLKGIMAADGDPYSVPMKLTHDVIWNAADASFAPCSCDGERNASHSIAVQDLLPSTMHREVLRIAHSSRHDGGAVIFGFNKANKWFWGDTGPPSRTPIHLEQAKTLSEQPNTYSEDSGLGKSLVSSMSRESASLAGPSWHANEDPSPSQRRMVHIETYQQVRPRESFPTAREYKVGIVCALYIELMAVRALFDKPYPNLVITEEDPNYYALGRMGGHNVAAVCLPHGIYGTNAATDVASNMRRSFPCLKFCLLVGIGAGVPSSKNDIRLGDVVVSTPSGRYSGVLPYDMIRSLESGASQLNGYLCPPPQTLMCAISELESDPNQSSTPLDEYLHQIQQCKPQYNHPGVDKDRLFASNYAHPNDNGTCEGCDSTHLVRRVPRFSTHPRIFYGLIASGNRLMRSAQERDRLSREHNVLCFEMEGAGIMNSFPCLIIRGISDYADSHKDKTWQNYASATAAAYAKLLLCRVRISHDSGSPEFAPVIDTQRSSRKRPQSPGMAAQGPTGKRRSGQMDLHGDDGLPSHESEASKAFDTYVQMGEWLSDTDEL